MVAVWGLMGVAKFEESRFFGGQNWRRLLSFKPFPGPLATFWFRKRDKWKQTSCFLGIQRQRLAAKVQPGEVRPELGQDARAAFGTESATMRGSFWTRIRWGNVVAAAGVRGQDGRKKGKQSLFL